MAEHKKKNSRVTGRRIEWFGKKLREERGETLLEVTISIALFALMALMVASMFGMANQSTMRNLQTDETYDKAVTDIVTEQNLDQTQEQEVVFRIEGGGSVSRRVERIRSGSLYRFRN